MDAFGFFNVVKQEWEDELPSGITVVWRRVQGRIANSIRFLPNRYRPGVRFQQPEYDLVTLYCAHKNLGDLSLRETATARDLVGIETSAMILLAAAMDGRSMKGMGPIRAKFLALPFMPCNLSMANNEDKDSVERDWR